MSLYGWHVTNSVDRTMVMRRLILVALAGVFLVIVGILLAVAPTTGAAYSVQQLDREVRLHPHAWIGRTVSVHAVVLTYGWGSGHGIIAGQQTLLIDPPLSSDFFTTVYGSRLVQLNGPGVASSVFITGSKPQPSNGKRILIALAHFPAIKHIFGTSPEIAPDIYRVQIVRTGPCPTPFSGFCPTGIAM